MIGKRNPVVGKIDTVTGIHTDKMADALLVGIMKKTLIPEDLFETCVNMGITVHECLEDRAGWQEISLLTTACRIYSPDFQRQSDFPRQAMMKRTMDICGGIVGMILTGIITIFLPGNHIASPGPIFFSQIRVGKNGKLFKIYKFQACIWMQSNARKN